MKTRNVFPCFMLVCTLFLLGSCTAYQDAQWLEGSDAKNHPLWGNNQHDNDCPHHLNTPNNIGSMSGAFPFSMRNEYFTYCHKCGRNVRERQ